MKRVFGWILVLMVFVYCPPAFFVWWAYCVGKKRAEERYRREGAISVPAWGVDALRGTSPPTGRGVERWTKIDGYVGGQFL